MGSLKENRKAFERPSIDLSTPLSDLGEGSIRSLPDLIKFNAKLNPNHVFAEQEIRHNGRHIGFVTIEFIKLRKLVLQSISWIQQVILASSKGCVQPERPIALFLESDLTLFIHLCSLLELNVPVLLLSARLSKAATKHLLSESNAQAIICSARTDQVAKSALEDLDYHENDIKLINAVSYSSLLEALNVRDWNTEEPDHWNSTPSEDVPGALILHSSGTTGLPKPISLAHRYLLGYANCHRLEPMEADNRLNLSTLPLYHGFGLLSPCLSLSTGKTCLFPSSSVIPSAESTAELLRITESHSLMTVPTILEEMVNSDNIKEYCQLLARLDFVAIGGGPLKPQVAETLAGNKVKLLNHYGATEIGAIAYIFIPDKNYDWHYLRLRSDMGLELEELREDGENTGFYKLVGKPFGWKSRFEIQDRLERNLSCSNLEVKVLGRNDDLIVLASGEKVLPQRIETVLSNLDYVKAAVVFGEHHNEIGVLVELSDNFKSSQPEQVRDKLWFAIQNINHEMDGHARISSPKAILLSPADKVIPRSDKGSIQRKETYELYSNEIKSVYENLEGASTTDLFILDKNRLTEGLRDLVQTSVGDRMSCEGWEAEDDFFEHGMDSLEALRLSRRVKNIQNQHEFPGLVGCTVTVRLIYKNPSIAKLEEVFLGRSNTIRNDLQRCCEMRALRERYTRTIRSYSLHQEVASQVILLTGSTGHLGANILAQLVKARRIKKVICMNRKAETMSRDRQLISNTRQGINLQDKEWAKIEFIDVNTQSANFDIRDAISDAIACQISHIIHNAWPMNFQRTLASYESQISLMTQLLDLTRRVAMLRRGSRPKILFLSSIAVAARYPGRVLKEERIVEPAYTSSMGYAEAKWVCEELMANAAKLDEIAMQPLIVRVGQLTGSTVTGYWNPHEHLPLLIQASQNLGLLPDLHGTYSWLPVDTAANAITEILFSETSREVFYHVENPIRQPWSEMIAALGYKLEIQKQKPIPFEQWIHKASMLQSKGGNIQDLQEFLLSDFQSLAQGGIILDTRNSRSASSTMVSSGGIGAGLLDRYLNSWQIEGLLDQLKSNEASP